MSLLGLLTDPSIGFVGICFSFPFIFSKSNDEYITFLTNPYLWSVLVLLALTVAFTSYKSKTKGVSPLTVWETKLAQWYLMNGIFIHILMDGLSVFHAVPSLHDLYYMLDSRYKGDATIDVLSLLELFVMAPMCIALYYGVHLRSSWRAPLQILLSGLQIMGTFMYLGTEAYWGWIHVMVDWKLEFTKEHLSFFWFSFVFGILVWIIVPFILIISAFKTITSSAYIGLNPIAPRVFMVDHSVFQGGRVAMSPSLKRTIDSMGSNPTSPYTHTSNNVSMTSSFSPLVGMSSPVSVSASSEAIADAMADFDKEFTPLIDINDDNDDDVDDVVIKHTKTQTKPDNNNTITTTVTKRSKKVVEKVVDVDEEEEEPKVVVRRSSRRSVGVTRE